MLLPISVDHNEVQIEVDDKLFEIGLNICKYSDSGEINCDWLEGRSKRMRRVINMRRIMVIGLREAVAIEKHYNNQAESSNE